jgi:hypothetical protein
MNRRELEAMRERLASRSAAIEEDSPLLLWVGAILWAVVVILFCFL